LNRAELILTHEASRRERPTESATSDEVVRARTALSESPLFVLRDLTVQHVDDCLLISGSVTSFYHKQLAQEVVRAVAPSLSVVNQVEVRTAPTGKRPPFDLSQEET
jgi:hypothetical protein